MSLFQTPNPLDVQVGLCSQTFYEGCQAKKHLWTSAVGLMLYQ